MSCCHNFANTSTTYLTLNGDRYPVCFNTGPDDEIITGGPFTQSKEFEAWYNQYSACAPEHTPSTKQFKVANTGSQAITVNGTTLRRVGGLTMVGLGMGALALEQSG